MGMFEFVAVLTSIIVGLGITHLLQGTAKLVQHWHRISSECASPGTSGIATSCWATKTRYATRIAAIEEHLGIEGA